MFSPSVVESLWHKSVFPPSDVDGIEAKVVHHDRKVGGSNPASSFGVMVLYPSMFPRGKIKTLDGRFSDCIDHGPLV